MTAEDLRTHLSLHPTRAEAARALGVSLRTLRRWERRLDAGEPIRRKRGRPIGSGADPAPCSERGCDRPARSLGLCWAHYQRQRRASEPGK